MSVYPASINPSHSSSEIIFTPRSWASLSFDPAPGPATTRSVFLDTEPATLAPSDSARAFASLRLIFSSVPVKTTVLPPTSNRWIGGVAASTSAATALICSGLLAAPLLIAYSLAPVILQAVSSGTAWGRVAALFKLAESIGIALGASVVGVLSDRLSSHADGIGWALAAAMASILAITGTVLIVTRRKLPARAPTHASRVSDGTEIRPRPPV